MKKNKKEVKTEVKRFPIMLTDNSVMVITVMQKHRCISDIWMSDCYHWQEGNRAIQTEAAHQLIDQLDNEWTPLFLMELRKVIKQKLVEHDKVFGTKFEKESR